MQSILAIDVGTTGTKVALVDQSGALLASGYGGYDTYSAAGNWVEQSPLEL